MEQLNKAFEQSIADGILKMTISSPKEKNGETKVKIRPVLLKGKMCYQKESFVNNQVFHTNLSSEQLLDNLKDMADKFLRFNWVAGKREYSCLVSKKGKVTLKSVKVKEENIESMDKFTHNRKKNYLLPSDEPGIFLLNWES